MAQHKNATFLYISQIDDFVNAVAIFLFTIVLYFFLSSDII